jgi:hypothetical protein
MLDESHFSPIRECIGSESTGVASDCGAVHTDIERLPGVNGFGVHGDVSLHQTPLKQRSMSFWCTSDIPDGMPAKGILGLAPASPFLSGNAFHLVLSDVVGKLALGDVAFLNQQWLPSEPDSDAWLPLIDFNVSCIAVLTNQGFVTASIWSTSFVILY